MRELRRTSFCRVADIEDWLKVMAMQTATMAAISDGSEFHKGIIRGRLQAIKEFATMTGANMPDQIRVIE